jgi:vitamin B12 transporter
MRWQVHSDCRSIARRTSVLVGVPLVLFCIVRSTALAQSPSQSDRLSHGTVVSRMGPIEGANVFIVQTLDGALTSSRGSFSIPVRDRTMTAIRLAARKVGYRPVDSIVTRLGDSIVIVMESIDAMAPVSVLAGRFTANSERTAALTPIEVMTTPGGGDVNSAVKTLPGVQNVDEGTGLFVRGGDYTETRTFIDGAPMFTAYQFAQPTGSVAGTINPFLTDGITFSAGGFGARYGNTLSGIVDLRPQGQPQSTSVSVNATLLSVGAGARVRLDHGLGASATVGLSDLTTLFAVNGNPRHFTPAPHGSTESAQGVWQYSATGRITLFTLRQTTAMGVRIDDPAQTTTYYSSRRSDVAVASLHDTLGSWRPFLSLSSSGLARGDSQSVYRSRSTLRAWQGRAELEYAFSTRATVTAGAEDEWLAARFDTRTPVRGYDPIPGAPTSTASLNAAANRDAEYVQVDVWPASSVELVASARTDRSGFAIKRTSDPRLSVAWHVGGQLTLTGSIGVYHQVVDPAFLEEAQVVALSATRATMAIGGAQLGDGDRFLRLELWRKRYSDLAALTRDFETVAGLPGRASGFDLFARSPGPMETRWRLTWSSAWSLRVDPNTSIAATAPFDVTHSVTGVAERDWASGWHVGVAQRVATGRPFTEVAGASYDTVARVFVPVFAAPDGARLPTYRRADIAISRATALGGGRFLVVFGAIQNALNTVNLASYTWTRDYSERVPVRSAINRTLFIGANLVQGRSP